MTDVADDTCREPGDMIGTTVAGEGLIQANREL